MQRPYTCRALCGSASDASSGNVYVFSQSSSVDLPKMPTLGYCDAWRCVSALVVSR